MNARGRKCGHCEDDDGCDTSPCKKCGIEIKLFGVQITVQDDGSGGGGESATIRKSKSLGNLQSCNSVENAAIEPSGYLSDGYQSSKSHERKRGKPWSEDEHRSFLAGLEKLGKGDWKGIATNFVPTRSSTQVASHAQKYFNRLSATEKKRRRASVFDIPLNNGNLPSNKANESSSIQVGSSAAATKNVIEHKGQPSMLAPVLTTTFERPPLSPMSKHGFLDYFPFMVYQHSFVTLLESRERQQLLWCVSRNLTWFVEKLVYKENHVISQETPFCSRNTPQQLVQSLALIRASSLGLHHLHLYSIQNDFQDFVMQPRVSSFNEVYPTPTVNMKFSSQSSVWLPNIYRPHGSFPASGSVVPKTTNDELNLSIRKLTL